jgi:hypothetical protein
MTGFGSGAGLACTTAQEPDMLMSSQVASVEVRRARPTISRRHLTGEVWTAAEMRIVQRLYPDYEAMLKALPNRSYWAIRGFAQNYGIASKRHVWTTAEISKLRALYSRQHRTSK